MGLALNNLLCLICHKTKLKPFSIYIPLSPSLFLSLSLSIYIYIYVCVRMCVWVCVCVYGSIWGVRNSRKCNNRSLNLYSSDYRPFQSIKHFCKKSFYNILNKLVLSNSSDNETGFLSETDARCSISFFLSFQNQNIQETLDCIKPIQNLIQRYIHSKTRHPRAQVQLLDNKYVLWYLSSIIFRSFYSYFCLIFFTLEFERQTTLMIRVYFNIDREIDCWIMYL